MNASLLRLSLLTTPASLYREVFHGAERGPLHRLLFDIVSRRAQSALSLMQELRSDCVRER